MNPVLMAFKSFADDVVGSRELLQNELEVGIESESK
jgi:hypothetical protein